MHGLISRLGTRFLAQVNSLNPTSHGRHAVTRIAQTLGFVPEDGFHKVRGVVMNLKVGDFIDRSIYFDSYEFLVREIICRNLTSGKTFVDVGANIGYYSLLAAQRIGETGNVFAVEASPKTLLRLKENIAINKLSNVSIIPFAVGDASGVCNIYTPDERTHGVASLRDQGYGSTQISQVEIRKLDDLLKGVARIDVVKIDIEGAEMSALVGMRQLLEEYHPVILVEIVPKFLHTFGHTAIGLVDFILGVNPEYRIWHINKHRIIQCTMETLRKKGDDAWGNFAFSKKHPLRS